MRRLAYVLALVAALVPCYSAAAGTFAFTTHTTATQKLASPLFGGASPVTIVATGSQDFTFDTGTGIAGVTSDLNGTDFPNPFSPGSFLAYHLTNTTTVGSTSPSLSGPNKFIVTFPVQFSLTITTPGPLAGLTFVTNSMPPPTFIADTSLPFPPGTTFNSPDPVGIFAPVAEGPFSAGQQVGVSFDRTVVIDAVTPEPAGLVLAGIGVLGAGGYQLTRRRRAV